MIYFKNATCGKLKKKLQNKHYIFFAFLRKLLVLFKSAQRFRNLIGFQLYPLNCLGGNAHYVLSVIPKKIGTEPLSLLDVYSILISKSQSLYGCNLHLVTFILYPALLMTGRHCTLKYFNGV